MEHMSPLIGVLVIGLGLAFVLGTLVQRLGLPPLVGYLLAGVAVGPFTSRPRRSTRSSRWNWPISAWCC